MIKPEKPKSKRPPRSRRVSLPSSAGGAAAATGAGYEHRVAAWVAVHMLGEQGVPLPWDLPADATLSALHLQTDQPVDDILARTSYEGQVFIQAKHKLSLGTTPDSEITSALDQFVRQFLAFRVRPHGDASWERPLDSARDRLVLVMGPSSSATVREHARNLLDHVRELTSAQRLANAAKNRAELVALRVICGHLKRSWKQATGRTPGEVEIRQVLALVYIEIVDVDRGGRDERLAKTYLRTVVLQNPTATNTAWSTLVRICGQLAETRGATERAALAQMLLDEGIELQAPVSYRRDIQRLQDHTRLTLESITRLAEIRVGARPPVKIDRPSVQALMNAAEENSLLVIGEPGVGKTAALHDVTRAWMEAGRDVVLLVADQIGATNPNLFRTEMGLSNDFRDILLNWPGPRPAFLVIDALDKAGSERAEHLLFELMANVLNGEGRWHVIAAVRKFDLRHSPRLRGLFPGTPPTEFTDGDFSELRHVNVPQLTDDELGQVTAQSPQLGDLLAHAPALLRDLLRIPFNLRLMGELLGSGVAVEQLTPIRSQIELLERYWAERVRGDIAEAILRRAAEVMIETRTLRVDRTELASMGNDAVLTGLLSAQLLVGWRYSETAQPRDSVLTFAHHVLFDYAVARWLRNQTLEQLVTRLVREPELILAIRPSLGLHCQYLWLSDPRHVEFWDFVFLTLCTPNFPAIAKLAGPTVAAESASEIAEFDPIFARRESARETDVVVADEALRFVVGAIGPGSADVHRPILGPQAGPWCALAERISRLMTDSGVYTLRLLLVHLCEHPENFTNEQRQQAGVTARRLLTWAWDQQTRWRYPRIVRHAIEAVCRTFESDPVASSALLRLAMGREHLERYGYEEMPAIAEEAGPIFRLDPQFVEDLYATVFTFEEPSDAPTQISDSRIMGMVSNRRQDYGMARYILGELYGRFLQQAPLHAIRALLVAVRGYAPYGERQTSRAEATFDFNGREARYTADDSYMWDSSDAHRHEEPVRLLREFSRALDALASQGELTELRWVVIDLIVAQNQAAVIWKRLLEAGASAPPTLGVELRPLAWARPILIGRDTTVAAGHFIGRIFPNLAETERQRVEYTILAIAEDALPSQREVSEYVRNRLLGCLPFESIVTAEARQTLAALRAANAVPENAPLFQISTWSRAWSDDDLWRDMGVSLESDVVRRFRDTLAPVQEFANRFRNGAPTDADLRSIFPALQALRQLLSDNATDTRLLEHGWGCLAEACERIAKCDTLTCDNEIGTLIRDILLEASQRLEPLPDPEHDTQFDQSPGWSSPAVRLDAAAGIILLAKHPTCVTDEIWEALDRLSADPVPSVRLQIAERLNALYETARERMWAMIERIAREESSQTVVQSLMLYPFRHLAPVAADRVIELTTIIHARFHGDSGARGVRDACAMILTDMYVSDDNAVARDILFGWIESPTSSNVELQCTILSLRDRIIVEPVQPPIPLTDAIRGRAVALLLQIVRAVREALQHIRAAHSNGFADLTPEEGAQVRDLVELANTAAREVYFSSGAFHERQNAPDGRTLTLSEKQRFLQEIGPVMDELTSTGLPAVVHSIVETLESLVPADPADVLMRVGQTIRAGEAEGYQFESLAVDRVVRMIERYLAEYRPLLRENPNCQRTLREMLDTFVNVGWPNTWRLTYRLDEIYR